ncbi:MAG: LytTR family transcriptional regulator DNA-binding domain-containing protein [Asticcacaulis sp.]|nr:LytTR family transcriptional regulator DNA-binding domain-containing protein [Asticcacaulis sp.]
MREPTASIRENRPVATGASPLTALLPWLRTYSAAAGMALFLCLIGANGSDALPFGLRWLYWTVLMVGGTVIGHAVGAWVDRSTRLNTWQTFAVIMIAVTPPITLLVWLVTCLFTARTLNVADIRYFIGPVMIISIAMSLIQMMINRTPAQSHAFHEPRITEPGAAFRERLEFKYRHADIYALSAEDHYLRVYSSAGESLILMRLYDAIRELDGIEGSQTHRSWWVAKQAVADVNRRDGRVSLALKNGVSAPVSRSYSKALKTYGWL